MASADSYKDLEELGIDCDENNSLTDTFNKAANHLQSLVPTLDNDTLLSLYGYYKQGSQGPCKTPKPSWFDMRAKSKWESWHKLGDMSQDEAKTLYINLIKKLDPKFADSKELWVSVSTLQQDEEEKLDEKTIIDYIKDGNCTEVENLLRSGKVNIDKVDESGLGLIHWASDIGALDILKVLIQSGANINLQDTDGQTALHYAASCGHLDCIKFLLDHGANKDILDGEGQCPEFVASDSTVKELFK